jgi:NifB/MoaA-like Fe-S oxidoreductase
MLDRFLAARVLDQIERWQKCCLARMSTRFVFGADELYLQAQRPFPPYSAYEDFSQIENGVGLVSQFEHQSLEVLSETEPRFCSGVCATLVCGLSAYNILKSFVHGFNSKARSALQLHPVTNKFWGESVSVSGLLTGQDVIDSLKAARDQGFNPGLAILLPEVMFKDDSDILLDDINIRILEEQLGVKVKKIGADPWAVLDAVEELHACSAS